MLKIIAPRAVGCEVVFESHGNRFYLKRLAGKVFCLSCPLRTGRVRFADTAKEIMKDVESCFETGVLPGSPGRA
jgi:hypothetical protein